MQRQTIQDSHVNFRVNGAVLARAERAARHQGMSLSEYLRACLRKELTNAD